MSRKPPAFQFYASDFFSGVADMTDAEVGIYIRLLCLSWDKGGLSERQLPSASHEGDEAAVRSVLKWKFHRDEDGLWRNARLEETRQVQLAQPGRPERRSNHASKLQANRQANAKQTSSKSSSKPASKRPSKIKASVSVSFSISVFSFKLRKREKKTCSQARSTPLGGSSGVLPEPQQRGRSGAILRPLRGQRLAAGQRQPDQRLASRGADLGAKRIRSQAIRRASRGRASQAETKAADRVPRPLPAGERVSSQTGSRLVR